jgi:hypothetical protein
VIACVSRADRWASIDAFTKLARDIVDISKEFSHFPITPPNVGILFPPSFSASLPDPDVE